MCILECVTNDSTPSLVVLTIWLRKFIWVVLKELVSTAQRTQCISITKMIWLILFILRMIRNLSPWWWRQEAPLNTDKLLPDYTAQHSRRQPSAGSIVFSLSIVFVKRNENSGTHRSMLVETVKVILFVSKFLPFLLYSLNQAAPFHRTAILTSPSFSSEIPEII
jgi:hypothetical protein